MSAAYYPMLYILIAETTLFCSCFKGDFCLANTDVPAYSATVISFSSKCCSHSKGPGASNHLETRFGD